MRRSPSCSATRCCFAITHATLSDAVAALARTQDLVLPGISRRLSAASGGVAAARTSDARQSRQGRRDSPPRTGPGGAHRARSPEAPRPCLVLLHAVSLREGVAEGDHAQHAGRLGRREVGLPEAERIQPYVDRELRALDTPHVVPAAARRDVGEIEECDRSIERYQRSSVLSNAQRRVRARSFSILAR
jgi:hypothetical protein